MTTIPRSDTRTLVQGSYIDATGRRRRAPTAVLDELRATLGGPRVEAWIEPVHVAWNGRLRVAVTAPRNARWLLRDADSGTEVAAGRVDHATGQIVLDPASGPLLHGYYDLRVSAGRSEAQALVVAAPRRLVSRFAPGTWGAFLPAYALRRDSDQGIGDYAGLGMLGEWIGARGGSMLATTPLLATFIDSVRPFDRSPYSPVSRRFWNPSLIDLHSALEVAGPSARRAFRSAAVQDELAALDERALIDAARVGALKRRIITAISDDLADGGAALAAFLASHPDVVDYARFRAVGDRLRAAWQEWPDRQRGGALRTGDRDPADERYHACAQWLAERQLETVAQRLRTAGVELYLDLPIGANPSGYDTWHEPELFVAGVSVGAPPDDFFVEGQDWGFAPIHPDRQRQQGYRHLIAVLRHHLRHARVLRIDHVMGLHRLFVMPHGRPPREGAYLRYPAEELHAIVNLEASRVGATVIGEDLGTVPAGVRPAMRRHGLLGIHVAQFAVTAARRGRLPVPSAASLATVNTHDTPTWAGFCRGLDLFDRRDAGGMSARACTQRLAERRRALRALGRRMVGTADAAPGRLLAAIHDELVRGPAAITLINLEDLWGEELPQNTPGTGPERDNWIRRTRDRFERWSRARSVRTALDRLSATTGYSPDR